MAKFLNKLKEILNPPKQEVETQTTILQKKAGTYNVECAIDEEVVDCKEMSTTPYTGIPAPVVLSNDSWFGDVTYKSQKQEDYMERETEMKMQEQKRREEAGEEPENIHQLMYEMATKNQSTTLHIDPPGGSENFHEGPGGWKSGNGMGQFQK